MWRRCAVAAAGVAGLLLAAPASAQTWLGGTSVTWTTGANWDGGVAPTSTGTAVFGAAFGTFQPSLTSGTVLGLQFLKPDGGWTIGIGGSLRITDAGVDDSLNTSGTTTLDGNVTSGFDGQTWSVGVGGTIRVNGRLLLASSGHDLIVEGGLLSVASLQGGGNGNSQKFGSGTLLVTGSSTTVNQFEVAAGTVILGNPFALGSGSVIRALSGTMQASTDLTGANAIPKELLIGNFTISGTQSLQISARSYQQTSSGNSFLTNNLVAGKTLTLGNVTGNNATSGNLTMTFQGSGHTIVSGSMTNGLVSAFSYTKAGSGRLTLSGTGSYGGTMTVAEGTLELQNAAALGTSSPLVVSGGTLDLGGLTVTKSGVVRFTGGLVEDGTLANNTQAFDGQAGTVTATLAGTGGLTKSTAGLLVLSGSNTYTGTTTVAASGGRLHFAARNALYGGGTASWTAANVIVNTSGTLSLATGGAGEFSEQDVATLLAGIGGTINNNGLRAGSRIGFDTANAATPFTIATTIADTVGTGSGAVGLVKLGSGTLVLTGSNSYTGPTNVSGGVLRLGAANALGTGTVSLDGGLLDMNGNNGSVAALALGGTTATGFTGGGTLTLGGTVTYTANPAGAVIGTNLALSGTRTFTIGGSGVGADALTVSTVISSTGGLTKTGTGRLVLSGTASTYTGRTTIQSGVVEVASLANAGVNSSLGAPTTASGTIDLGTGTTLGTLRYTGAGHSTNRPIRLAGSSGGGGVLDASGSGTVSFTGGVTSGNGLTLTLTGSNTGNNFTQGIAGGRVVKTGVGTWVLGTNSFRDGLTIEQGTIIAAVSASGSFSPLGGTGAGTTDPVVGLADATGTAALLLAASGTISRTIEVAAAGTGSQEVIIGGAGTGTSFFDSTGTLKLGRDVTLAADPGGTVVFSLPSNRWQTLTGGSDATAAITIGTPTATGTVTQNGTFPNTIPRVTVRQGTLRLGNGSTTGALGPDTTLTGSAGATLAFNRSDTITSGSQFASTISGGLNVSQIGSGTVVFNGVNTYTGVTSILAGIISFNGTNALRDTSGVSIRGGAGLTYTGGATAFGKNVTILPGTGTGTIRNSGGSLLTLSGNLSKDNSILRFTGGAFNVTGVISGPTPGTSDLIVDAALVTFSNVNTYDGPTFVYGSGTLALGIDNAIPNASVVTLGNASSRGTLDTGAFTDTVAGLAFSGLGGTLRVLGDRTASAHLISTGGISLGPNADLVLTTAGTTAGLYRLVAAPSISLAFASISGTSAAYQIVTTSTSIDYQQRAVLGAVTASGPVSIITGGSAAFTYTVTNGAFSGGQELAFTGVGTGAVIGSTSGTALGGATSAAIGGLVYTGTGVGLDQAGTFTVTTPSAFGALSTTGTLAVNVLNHSLASFLSTSSTAISLNLGTYNNGWESGSGSQNYSIWNIASGGFTDAQTAGLDLYEWVFASGDDVFTTGLAQSGFANLAAGTSNAFTASIQSPGSLAQGDYQGVYTLRFRDQSLPGAINTRDLTLTLNVIVVPEPGTLALTGLGLAAASWGYRRRRAQTRVASWLASASRSPRRAFGRWDGPTSGGSGRQRKEAPRGPKSCI